MIRLTTEQLLANAGVHAASGDWVVTRDLLIQHEDLTLTDSQLAILRAEAELRTGRPREAREWLTPVIPAIERTDDRRSIRIALNLSGVAELELGAVHEAEHTFGRLIELARNDGDDLLTARAFNNLGTLADMRDRFDDAIMLYERAIPLYQRLGSTRGLAETHHNVAISLRHRGQFQNAEEHERRAITYASEGRSSTLESLARLGLGEVALERGDPALAGAIAGHAAKSFAKLDDAIREADALRVLAAACLAQRKFTFARDAVARALLLATANGARLLEAEVRRLNAELLFAGGNQVEARRESDEAARLFEELGSPAKAQETRAWRSALR